MELKLNDGTPNLAWWKSKVEMNLMSMPLGGRARDDLRKLWMGLANQMTSFASEFLTIVDYPSTLFNCCDSPEIVSTDGALLINARS